MASQQKKQKQKQKSSSSVPKKSEAIARELKEILVDQAYVPEKDFKEAREDATERDVTIVNRLIAKELLTRDILGQAVSEYYGVPFADLGSVNLPEDRTELVPYDIASKYRVVLFKIDDNEVVIATDKLNQQGLRHQMQQLFPSREITFAYALSRDVDDALDAYRQSLDTRFASLIEEGSVEASQLLDEVFQDALTFKASDIHFEPMSDEVLVRFRVDGVLQEAGRVPKQYYSHIVNRVKVRAELRIDTHNAMQDGSMRYETGDDAVDMRLSIAPTLDGEKIAIRLLAKYISNFSLSGLGLSSKQQAMLEEAAHKPFGMILVAGPTGSGKTTTLYAILKILNSIKVNITTIEDPVEYHLRGVNQIQVDEDAGITFADGLRSIVRQDPDTVLVGEIRDRETSDIALNAALTGHLMLSTFHANDAATGIPRMMDMGAEPFLLSSTLEVVIAQRLVRTICGNCRHSVEYSKADLTEMSPVVAQKLGNKKTTLYKGKGCNMCDHSGYSGRSAVFEIIQVTQEMRRLIMTSPSSAEIRELADEQGTETMFENGMRKVTEGKTTLEELLRIVVPPDEK